MKAKYALIALLAITFWGCDDNTAGLGLGMFPESDRDINGKLSTFDVTTESVHAGKIYAMTNVGYVGKFTDETFGTYQAGFLAQLNCPEGMTFPEAFSGTTESGTGKMMTNFENLEKSVSGNYTIIEDDNGNPIGNCQINIYLWYRPEVWEGRAVPDVLLGGDHQKIDAWRGEKSREPPQTPGCWSVFVR